MLQGVLLADFKKVVCRFVVNIDVTVYLSRKLLWTQYTFETLEIEFSFI